MPDHLGLLHHFAGIHIAFANDFQKLGNLGLQNNLNFHYHREKALGYWKQALERHPLQFSVKQNTGIFGFKWAENEYERLWSLQWMRSVLEDIYEAQQRGELNEDVGNAARMNPLGT